MGVLLIRALLAGVYLKASCELQFMLYSTAIVRLDIRFRDPFAGCMSFWLTRTTDRSSHEPG